MPPGQDEDTRRLRAEPTATGTAGDRPAGDLSRPDTSPPGGRPGAYGATPRASAETPDALGRPAVPPRPGVPPARTGARRPGPGVPPDEDTRRLRAEPSGTRADATGTGGTAPAGDVGTTGSTATAVHGLPTPSRPSATSTAFAATPAAPATPVSPAPEGFHPIETPAAPRPAAPAPPMAPVPSPGPGIPPRPDAPPVETTTRLRPIVPTPSGPPPARVGRNPFDPPEVPSEVTARLRPIRDRRTGRAVGAVACAVLGLGLIGGAVTARWLTGDSSADSARGTNYAKGRTLWHSVPVDTLFPRTIKGESAGPGRADRVWTRVAVAPDGDCASALGPLLVTTLQQAGCARVLRATYTDATSTHVTTVGMVFTEAGEDAMDALALRFRKESLAERPDLIPRTFPAQGTVAAGFGDRQRASWAISVLTDVPVVVYAVSGFADGRVVNDPQPADAARARGATSAPAQAGLGHEAEGLAAGAERALMKSLPPATEPST
ncbi:hypothetical protein ACIBCM_16460 [Streptomyces sp. NPDC051018]|uniref:hypothetical protein n=1 Tax=Streptomyces sp. NPDC051018 TaxID=3365639 RepID=UPI00379B25B6